MPVRNIIKPYAPDQYYHFYTRGVNKQVIFKDSSDYEYLVGLFARYLSPEPTRSPSREIYPHFGSRLELLAFCLMPNHIHILLYQHDDKAMAQWAKALLASYSMYFNKKYERRGPLFESHYLASHIDQDNYLQHISRYIHLNPREWRYYAHSSLAYYLGEQDAAWLKPERILGLFDYNAKAYLHFVQDYVGQKAILDELKYEIAHE